MNFSRTAKSAFCCLILFAICLIPLKIYNGNPVEETNISAEIFSIPANEEVNNFRGSISPKSGSIMDFRPSGFLENKGQWEAEDLQFLLDKGGLQVALGRDRFTYVLNYRESTSGGDRYFQHNIQVELLGANPSPRISKTGKSSDFRNYFFGTAQASKVHHYEQVTYHDVYPGIDVVFETATPDARRMGFKYSFIVHPGADPDQIQLIYNGQDELGTSHSRGIPTSHESDEENLVSNLLTLTTEGGVIGEDLKEVYTISSGIRESVPARFQLDNDNLLTYDLDAYDQNKTLVIDPDLVSVQTRRATYYGSNGTDRIRDISSDSDANIYVAGVSSGENNNMSVTGSYQVSKSTGNSNDMVIGKFNSDLSQLLSATYYGGTGDDAGRGIDLDDDGKVYVAGYSASSDLPTEGGGTYSSVGGEDMVIAKFDNDLTTLEWVTGIGGTDNDRVNDIVYLSDKIIGVGNSSSSGLQTTGSDNSGLEDALTFQLTASDGSADWSVYYGGARDDEGNGIAVFGSSIYATGVFGDGSDNKAFIAKYDNVGNLDRDQTYGDEEVVSKSIAISSDGSFLAISGEITSGAQGFNDAGLTNLTHQSTFGGGPTDAFLMSMDASDLSLNWSTYFGGQNNDDLEAVIIDCQDNILATGNSRSEEGITDPADTNSYNGGGDEDEDNGDAILTKFDRDGNRLWGYYFGADSDEEGIGMSLSSDGDILLCGATLSDAGIATQGTSSVGLHDADYSDSKSGLVGFVSTFCDLIIDQGPQGQTVAIGDDATFSISTNFCGTINSYQWTKDGSTLSDGTTSFGIISGSSSANLTISSVSIDAAGEYCVTISTTCGEETLCANLEVVSLAAQDVCLDSESVLGTAGANQDSIKLTFSNLETNTAITDAQYAWSVSSLDDVNGGNQAVSGSNGDFTATLPITLTDDLHDLTILPTAAGTYVYTLDISYTDSRRTDNPVTSTLDTTIVVYEFPTITGITPQPEEICEDGNTTLSFTTDIEISRASYERVDTNTDLTGHSSGDENGINDTSFDLVFNSFSNPTNQPLDAEYEITPFTSDGCAGPVSSFTITVNPNPEMEFMNVTDTICNEGTVNIDFAVLTTPDYTANGGTDISWTRTLNSDISPSSNSAGPFTDSGNISETLTNNSTSIQTVTYDFNAEYLGCPATPSQNVVVLPTITLDHSEDLTQDVCSGEGTNLQFGLAVSGIKGRIELNFDEIDEVTGDDDATLNVATNGTVSFPVTLVNTSNTTETVTATVTPIALLDGGGTECTGTPITFTFNVLPIPTISDDAETICENIDLNIDLDALSNGIAGTTYTWTATSSTGNVTGFSNNSGNSITESLQLTDGDTEGTVTYTVTPSAEGCDGTAGTITVTVLGSPDISFSPASAEICSSGGDPVEITANVSGTDAANIISYAWELDGTTLTEETSASISVSQPGEYTVAVTSEGGCTIENSITIDEVTRAEVVINEGPAASLCLDSDFTLTTTVTGGDADTFQWLLDGTEIAGATSETYDANVTGSYQVVVNGSGACPDTSDAITLTFFPTAVPNFTIDPDVSEVCPNTTLTLEGEDTNGVADIDEVSWSVTGASPLPTFTDATSLNTELVFGENQTGTDQTYEISLTLVTTDDCDSTYSETVIHRSRPMVSFTFDSENCPGEVSATQATTGATEYSWELVSMTTGLSIINPTDPDPTFDLTNNTGDTIFHEVQLIASNANGCSDTLTQTLNSFPEPEIIITGSLDPICNGEAIALSSSTSNPGEGLSFTNYSWTLNGQSASTSDELNTNLINTGVTDSTYQIILTGTHDADCQSSDTVEITVHPDARAELTLLNGNTTEACVPIVIDSDVIGLVDYTEANTSDYLWEVDSAGTIVATATGLTPPSYEISEPEISVSYVLTAFSQNGCENDQNTITFTSYPASVAAFTAATSVCEGETVSFTDGSTNANTYSWDFGDGGSSDLPSPDHVFDNASFTEDVVYTVTLTTTSSDGCSDTETLNITVSPLPNASFDAPGGCGGDATTITNNSVGQGTLTYAWSSSNADVISFDDATSVTPEITFADEPALGDRDITIFLTVTSENNCQTTTQQNIQVLSRPTASLSFDAVQCLDDASFISTSSTASDVSAISSLIVDYGDGSDETFNSPFSEFFHSYADTGTYAVQIQAISADGCRDSAEYSIRMIDVPAPVISSTQDPATGCGPELQVDFDGSGSTLYGFETYLWDFGNGNTDTNLNPDSQFFNQDDTTEIIYDVSFTITSSLCENAEATTSVLVKPSPTAILESNVIVGCDDVAVQLFNESLGVFIDEPDTMYWDFGDGNTDRRFDLEVYPYTFQNDGFEDITYTVQLIAANACGRDTTTRDITVLPFNEDPTIFIEDPDRIYCTVDTISAEIVGLGGTVGRNISWFLSGEELTEFTSDSIGFPAPPAGNYELILEVEFPICGGSKFDTVNLVVQAGPDIDFALSNDQLCFGDTLEISNTGEIQSLQTSWNLGTGGDDFNALVPVPFVYDSSGNFTISMYLEDEIGCPTEITKEVAVAADIIPDFNLLNQPLCSSDSLVLENTSEGAQSFQWTVTLPDTVYTSTNRSDRFPPSGATGPVTIQLDAFQDDGFAGCVETKISTFTILDSPIASFSPSAFQVCQGDLVTFSNSSIGATDYEWVFEFDSIITEGNPEYMFSLTGLQPVVLTAISSAGCRKDTTVNIEVVPKPAAIFEVNTPACTGSQIGINNNSTNASGYEWLIFSASGDTLPRSTEFEPFVVINDPGVYTIVLDAFSESSLQGCATREQQVITVNQTPVANFDLVESKVCEDSLITMTNSSIFSERNVWRLLNNEGEVIDSIGLTNDNSNITYQRMNDFDDVVLQQYSIQLEAIGQGGCNAFDQEDLTVVSNPEPDFSIEQDPICGGIAFDILNRTVLSPNDGVIYDWYKDGIFLETSYSISPALARVDRPIGKDTLVNFDLQVTNDICFNQLDTTLVVPGFYGCDIAIPNAFSPNGDGFNDLFEVKINPLDYDNFILARISIFTTTESQIFQRTIERDSVDLPMRCETCDDDFEAETWFKSFHWDGSFQQKVIEDNRDAYFYRIEVECCNKQPPPITGYVQLIR